MGLLADLSGSNKGFIVVENKCNSYWFATTSQLLGSDMDEVVAPLTQCLQDLKYIGNYNQKNHKVS